MLSFRQLPVTLRLLLVSFLLFPTTTVAETNSSTNDLFRAIALQRPKRPELPICCLKTSSQLETAEDEVLLSFEEWKVKQLELQAQGAAKQQEHDNSSNSGSTPNSGTPNTGEAAQDPPAMNHDALPISQTYEDLVPIHPAETALPHFQVPTTDRFNYANLDCSARVHTAHRSAKSAASILSSKKDRYMLSPCKPPNGGKKFVVVELCDDIRIDTVQLANYEFFSGVFKYFSVSVSKTYTDSESWTHAGTYRAKNVRGVQSFRFPETLRDFYRYIRIDFHSNYGNEYYCPVSLLRVYGLTHLEEWKWDIWMAESRVKQAEALKAKLLAISQPSDEVTASSPTDDIPQTTPASGEQERRGGSIMESLASFSIKAAEISKSLSEDIIHIEPTTPLQATESHVSATSDTASNPTSSSNVHEPHESHVPSEHIPSQTDDTHGHPSTPIPTSIPLPSSISGDNPSSSAPSVTTIPSGEVENGRASSNATSSRRITSQAASQPVITIGSTGTTMASSVVPPPAPLHSTKGGESVYRTIMNKLAALETNYTLYTRYMDQQNGAIRELIKRLGEDIGRLEGVTRAQRTTSQRMLNDWEKQKLQMMIDYGQLVSRVEHLSDEILLEKRLGFTQLCLMLAVLVFMGLTRGSRREPIVVSVPRSMREWSKRHLSFSGDWTSRFRRKSLSHARLGPVPANAKRRSPIKRTSYSSDGVKVEFPKGGEEEWRNRPLQPISVNIAPTSARVKKLSGSRSRTPSLRNTPGGKRMPHSAALPRQPPPGTPTQTRASHLRPQMLQRSSSQGAQLWPAHTSKSAKKWARTAHLHPVKSPAHPHREYDAHPPGTNSLYPSDVFSAPADSFAFPRGTKDRQAKLRLQDQNAENFPNFWDGEDVASDGEWKRRAFSGLSATISKGSDDVEGDNWIDTDSVVESSDLDVDSLPIA
ncbi:hypothetical protein FA15DRAFT_701676 [Coprinopsis marcescibilis]|uniref:SUN domain-containing protein n=1 Tax=Coprinopsis marcescibilis TaxID=230819 RepID=A0A5C3L4R3_COPMA|nr:hypothetical protein FA15DRAFT_701676 [Coprinopsis marcescibilis]